MRIFVMNTTNLAFELHDCVIVDWQIGVAEKQMENLDLTLR